MDKDAYLEINASQRPALALFEAMGYTYISPADCDKQRGSRGHPPGPARGALALVLFAALKQILVGLPDAFIQIVLIHTDIPPGSDGAEAFFVCG